MYKVTKTEEEWKNLLTPEEYKVMREGSTESPFTCALLEEKRSGQFLCKGCGTPLFEQAEKFESGTGWPSFFQPIKPELIEERVDNSYNMIRTEVLCATCGSHLGHVFNDGPDGKLRYCVNGVALKFIAND